LKNEYWQRWDIILDEFVEGNSAFRLQAVSSIEIGVGDITNEQPGGTGTIYIDDITFNGLRCIDKNKAVADFDGDCDVDTDDLKFLVDRWLGTDFDADLIEDESVDFICPQNGWSIPNGVVITILLDAKSLVGDIIKVEVFANGDKIFEDTDGWLYLWTDYEPGLYSMKARAWDDQGNMKTTYEINFEVVE